MIKEVTENQNLQSRPPIVVVLGHVDHGKSSILEAIKDLKITAKESGGITQHIGAYEIEHGGKKITFLDTPGHEAFSAMRSRGSKVADIAILVVAAEEGVKPQTKEAITHIKKAGIPFIVAINKMDKPEANPDKVKRELTKEDILVESLGGQVPSIGVSAKTKKGIPELLELILLIADMEDLKGDLTKPAEGVVVEAYLDKHRGVTATLLLRDGILQTGDMVGTRSTFGKIKILEDFQGKIIAKALPAMPCIVLGLEETPQVGEKFQVYPDAQSAQQYIAKKERKIETGEVLVMEDDKRVVNLILKADVQGSLEAIAEVLKELPQEKVMLRVLKAEAGEINEGDIKLAKSSQAKVVGFRVKANSTAVQLAERDNIKIMTFDIIYDIAQGVRFFMERSVASERVRTEVGKLKALVIFLSDKNRQIVGGKVVEGEVRRSTSLELVRNEQVIGKGRIINLQKNKRDVDKAIRGDECGVLYEGDAKVEVGDILRFYVEESKKGEL
jgi:translation initiation factor IF-2